MHCLMALTSKDQMLAVCTTQDERSLPASFALFLGLCGKVCTLKSVLVLFQCVSVPPVDLDLCYKHNVVVAVVRCSWASSLGISCSLA